MSWSLYIPVPILGWATTVWARLMKPRIEFGSPVQKGRDATESWLCVPIKIHRRLFGSDELKECRIYLIDHAGPERGSMIQLRWGDAIFTDTFVEEKTLRAGTPSIVPIARRKDGEEAAYITDAQWFMTKEKYALPGSDNRRRFRLLLQSGVFEIVSDHFYLLGVPRSMSNVHFVLEIQYGGKGLAPIPIIPA